MLCRCPSLTWERRKSHEGRKVCYLLHIRCRWYEWERSVGTLLSSLKISRGTHADKRWRGAVFTLDRERNTLRPPPLSSLPAMPADSTTWPLGVGDTPLVRRCWLPRLEKRSASTQRHPPAARPFSIFPSKLQLPHLWMSNQAPPRVVP